MKKHILVFYISFIVCISNSIYADTKPTIAVLYFDNNLKKEILDQIIDYFIISLNEIGKYQVVERNQIDKVLKEQELQVNDTFTELNRARIGKLLNANYLLTGTAYYQSGNYNITAKIIEVETGKVINGASISCKIQPNIRYEINKASYALCNLIISEYLKDDNFIEIKGNGFISDEIKNKSQAKLMAKRAAEIDAKRNLLEYLIGLNIKSETKIENFIPKDDVISKVSGYISNIEISDIKYYDDICEVTIIFNLKNIYKIMKEN